MKWVCESEFTLFFFTFKKKNSLSVNIWKALYVLQSSCSPLPKLQDHHHHPTCSSSSFLLHKRYGFFLLLLFSTLPWTLYFLLSLMECFVVVDAWKTWLTLLLGCDWNHYFRSNFFLFYIINKSVIWCKFVKENCCEEEWWFVT